MGMSGNYHGVTYRDAAGWFGVSERTVRAWFTRYPELQDTCRSLDGQIDLLGLRDWYDNVRDQDQAGRRGNKGAPRKPDDELRESA